jgi:hypothetical protein
MRPVSDVRMAEELKKANLPQELIDRLTRMAPGMVHRDCIYVRSLSHKFGLDDERVDELFKLAYEPNPQP